MKNIKEPTYIKLACEENEYFEENERELNSLKEIIKDH